jgi:hypothetical protein
LRTICPVCTSNNDPTDRTRVAPPTLPPPPADPLAELLPGRILGGFEIIGEVNRGGSSR